MQFKTAESYPAELTPTRRDLASLISAREAASAELATLMARSQRLARAVADIGPLQDELNALNSAEANAMREWSELDTDAPPPVSDTKRRAKIESSIAAARAAKTAADGATAGLAPQIERVSNSIRSIALQIEQAAVTICVSEAMSLFPSLKAGIAALEALKARVDGARQFMLAATEEQGDRGVGPIRADFETFDRELAYASARPARAMVPDMGEWQALASALKDSPTATTEAQS